MSGSISLRKQGDAQYFTIQCQTCIEVCLFFKVFNLKLLPRIRQRKGETLGKQIYQSYFYTLPLPQLKPI